MCRCGWQKAQKPDWKLGRFYKKGTKPEKTGPKSFSRKAVVGTIQITGYLLPAFDRFRSGRQRALPSGLPPKGSALWTPAKGLCPLETRDFFVKKSSKNFLLACGRDGGG
ncbi:hypothetical protein D7X33_12775 [Butyricicoccus sp. 1XD8-22]|nr:hypothetical protein D7X33_12775 [Butyricicoccus sp. 1XD8-22]